MRAARHSPPPNAAKPRFVGCPKGEKRRIGAAAPNKKIARYKMGNVIVVMLPAVIGSGIALANTWTLKIAFFILCILSLYLIFFKVYKTNLKKIFGD